MLYSGNSAGADDSSRQQAFHLLLSCHHRQTIDLITLVAMESKLEHSLVLLIKAVAFYFSALALRELLPVLNRLLGTEQPATAEPG